MNKTIKLLFVLHILIVHSALSQSVFGKWKTIDDETGKTRSVVEIYPKGDQLFGRIIQLYRDPGEDPDPVCEECSGERKNQKIIGMVIITEMEKDDDEWTGGQILDPENGKVYRCKIWEEEGNLKVRGYISFLFRTQTWLPYED